MSKTVVRLIPLVYILCFFLDCMFLLFTFVSVNVSTNINENDSRDVYMCTLYLYAAYMLWRNELLVILKVISVGWTSIGYALIRLVCQGSRVYKPLVARRMCGG